MKMDKIKVGIIGCGGAGNLHALNFIHIPEAELVAFADIQKRRAEEYAKRYGAEAYYSDYKKLLKRSDIDAITITLPEHLHARVTIDAAESGKHILCEKPMALTIEECEKMIKATQRAKVKLLIGHFKRFFPSFLDVKSIIDSGEIGFPTQVYYRICLPKKRMGGPRARDGGFVVYLMTHGLNLLSWLFGPVEAVFSEMSTAIPEPEGEDNVTILLRFESGCRGTVEGSCSIPLHYTNTYEAFTVNALEGGIFLQPYLPFYSRTQTTVFSRDGIRELLSPSRPAGTTYHYWELKHFLQCIINDEEPGVSGEDGKLALKLALAALDSASSERWIKINTS